jgi:DNA repair protein RadC
MENEPFQSEYPVVRVRLIRESTRSQVQLSSPEDAMKTCEEFLADEDRENLIVLMLSAKNDLLGIHTASVGNLTSAIVTPREVFKAAILANAASIIIAHNHPSGEPEPSAEDIEVTRVIKLAGELLGIPLCDHIIVGGPSRSVSLKRRGLL